MIAVFIEIQRQGKILPWMRLCSGKMWKSNVKLFFSYNFPRWPVGVKSYHVRGTQVIAQSLKTRQQNRTKLEILQTAINTCLIIIILSLWLKWKRKKKKNLSQQKLRHLPENENSHLDTMTGTNSSNDRLILRQNVEINSKEYFLATYFFGNEIVDHVVWKRHCAITKKNVFEFRVISTIYYGLSNDYRCKFSFIHHLLLLFISFSFFKKNSPS